MSYFRTEGVILQALSFGDHDQILTVFSRDIGVQKFFYKGGQAPKRKKGGVSVPLTRAEIVYRIRGSDLYPCKEISTLSQNLALRKNLEILESACDMIEAILKTQLPGKAAPELYLLFIKYLEALPLSPYPASLKCSFFLKLLNHEGYLASLNQCSFCRDSLTALFFSRGEGFCENHRLPDALVFDSLELISLLILVYSRTLSEISELKLPEILKKKIQKMLKEFVAI